MKRLPVPPSAPEAEIHRRGMLVLHTWPILLIPAIASMITVVLVMVTAGTNVPQPDRPSFVPFPFVGIVVIIVFSSALVMLVRLGRPTISAIVLIGVWTFAVTFGWLRFGVTTYLPALLILPICAAGLLIDRIASISLAALAMVLVISIGWLEAQGFAFFSNSFTDPWLSYVVRNQYIIAVGFWMGIFGAVAALTSMLAGGVQRALEESRAKAQALQQLSDQLEERVAEQTARLLQQERAAATLEERTRLAREIHDTIAQGLTGVAVQIGAAQRALVVAPDAAQQHLELAGRMTRESLAEARRSVWNLRAQALERGDLGDALRSLAERHSRPELVVTFVQQGERWALAPAAESALLRLAQESISNALKHANARRIQLQLTYQPDGVRLTVHDDGQGFRADVLDQRVHTGLLSGFGLMGMRERLTALGGQLELRNSAGALVLADVPRREEGP